MSFRQLSEEEYQKEMRIFNEKLAKPEIDSLHQINNKIITGVLSVLEKNGIRCFLEFNSLLGKVRDNNYIPWSRSVVVSAINEVSPYENPMTKVKQSLNDHYINEKYYENMLCSSVIVGRHDNTKTVQSLIDHENKIYWCTSNLKHLHQRSTLPFRKLEIWLMVKSKENGNWHYKRFDKINNTVVPITDNDIFPLKECKLHGINTFMPNESEKQLQRLYGDNWQTPITGKHSIMHPENKRK